MRTQLIELQEQKKKKKQQLCNLRDEYLKTIYVGYIHKKSAKQVGQDLYDLTINNKKQNVYSPKMYEEAIILNNKLSRKIPQNILMSAKKQFPAYNDDIEKEGFAGAMALLIFALLDKLKARKKINRPIIDDLIDFEEDEKGTIIDKFINNSRKHLQVLYLSSSHNDCAEDHQDYQAKIYYDKNWKNIIDDKEDKRKIQKYITSNNLMSMQDVMGRPVWFITRPNCRHYFKALDTDIVLSNSVKDLTRKYKMHRAVGDREYLQTLQSSKNRKVIGEKRNAQLMIEKYEDRLQTHRTLYESFKSSLVKSAIQKDLQLIGKWKEYLSKL